MKSKELFELRRGKNYNTVDDAIGKAHPLRSVTSAGKKMAAAKLLHYNTMQPFKSPA